MKALLLVLLSFLPSEDAPIYVYDYVCEQIENLYENKDCSSIPPPAVVTTKLLRTIGAWGAYVAGEPYIFISPDSPHPEETLIHETAHYIIYNLGIFNDVCREEEVVRFVAGQTDTWRDVYGCKLKE